MGTYIRHFGTSDAVLGRGDHPINNALLDPIHIYPALVEVIQCSSVGLSYALRQLTKTTLPPLNFSLQSAAFYLRCGTGLAHG